MKNSHLPKSRDLRNTYARRLELTDSRVTRRYTATELMQLLGISKQHAYRLIADPERLTNQQAELLLYKDLRAVTDWGPGWYVEAEGLRAPNGYVITIDNMKYNEIIHRRQRDLIQQNKDMQQEIESLRNHVGWLQVWQPDSIPPTRR